MKTQKDHSTQYEFYVRDLDNLILVEISSDGVIIRAARDNFSERRRRNFIRHLAAEGFIPDECQWFDTSGLMGGRGVRWIIDHSWIRVPEEAKREAGRFMRRLLIGTVAFWLILMAAVMVLGTGHQGSSPVALNPPSFAGSAGPDTPTTQ
jgi:hypothetical protein